MRIEIPVSVGELIDKITILQIKSKYSNNEYILNELKKLTKIAEDFNLYKMHYIDELYEVNSQLWKIEDELRILEKHQDFGYDFIQCARSVYMYNDERAKIKRKINEETNSEYKEIKLY